MHPETPLGDEATRIAAALEDAHVTEHAGSGTADGTRGGIPLHVVWKRGRKVLTWYVESIAAGPKLLASVRRRGMGDPGAIASGAIVEVTTGDAEFDRDWLVEGAPAARTKLVFDEGVRRAIASAEMAVEMDEAKVNVGVSGAQFTAHDIERGIAAVFAVRARLNAIASSSASAPSDDAAIAGLLVKRDNIWARASWPARIAIVVFNAVLVAALLAGLFYGCGINALFDK